MNSMKKQKDRTLKDELPRLIGADKAADKQLHRMWSTGKGNDKPLQYSCLENPMNSMKRQNDRTLKDELPRSVGAMSISGSLSCSARLVRSPCAWQGGAIKASLVAQMVKHLPTMQETWVRSLG